MDAKKQMYRALIAVVGIASMSIAHADPRLPEFTGNYIECGGQWCSLSGMLLHHLSLSTPEKGYYANITYPGYFGLPEGVIEVKTKKPRIVLFSGRPNADPQTTALIEIFPMPFNGAKVVAADDKQYGGSVTYGPDNFKTPFWVMKREINLRFKPVSGQVGMNIYEPVEPLREGLYAIDVGTPGPGHHQNLRMSPLANGVMTHNIAKGALLFIVGSSADLQRRTEKVASQRQNKTANDRMPGMESGGRAASGSDKEIAKAGSATAQRRDTDQIGDSGEELGKAVGGLIKGIFGGSDR